MATPKKEDGSTVSKWTWRFILACVVPILIFVFLFRHLLGLDDLFEEGHVGIATVLGLIGMIGVSVGLMAAVFYSNRSGRDDVVHDVRRDKTTDE